MKAAFRDIRDRIQEQPTWYDEYGVPRYGEFTPDNCPNIYAEVVVLLRIACQACGQQFQVEMHSATWKPFSVDRLSELHYGDPPVHGCVGDSMNCDDLEILQVWVKQWAGASRAGPWPPWCRRSDLEGLIDGGQPELG